MGIDHTDHTDHTDHLSEVGNLVFSPYFLSAVAYPGAYVQSVLLCKRTVFGLYITNETRLLVYTSIRKLEIKKRCVFFC